MRKSPTRTPLRQFRFQGAFRAGGPRHFLPQPSPHLHPSRHRPAGRHGLSSDGVGGGRNAGTATWPSSLAARTDRPLRRADCRREFATGDLASVGRIWVLSLTGDRKPFPLMPATFQSSSAKFSPDGHWIAYTSNESGRLEVYVVPFGGGAGKWRISSGGGTQPIWRRDGKELFHWSADNTVLSVPIALQDAAVEVGVARPFMRLNSPIGNVGILSPYDVAADGQRLVFIVGSQQAAKPLTLVPNWTTALKHQ